MSEVLSLEDAVSMRLLQLIRSKEMTGGQVYHAVRQEFSEATPSLIGRCVERLIEQDERQQTH